MGLDFKEQIFSLAEETAEQIITKHCDMSHSKVDTKCSRNRVEEAI